MHICELYTPTCSIYLEINISALEIIFLRKFTSLPFFTEILVFHSKFTRIEYFSSFCTFVRNIQFSLILVNYPILGNLYVFILKKTSKKKEGYPSNSVLPHFHRLCVQSHCSGCAQIFCSKSAAYCFVILSGCISDGLSAISSKRTR